MAGPIELLRQNRQAVVKSAADVGVKRMRVMLGRAQAELNERLRRAEGLGGAGKDSFTAHQMRVALVQVQHVLAGLKKGIKAMAVSQADATVDPSVAGMIRYLREAEKKFAGITERLPLRDAALFERAHSGAESSVLHRLEGDPKKGPGILKRYGDGVVEKFEGRLQQRLLARAPWEDVRNGLIADSPFLQQAPASWAERIVRTEAMNGSNRALWEANKEADTQLGDVVKILSATFDNRTGSDSIAIHGQIRKPEEAFEWWDGLYQHPPNRPNDREVVVTHRLSWPIPPELAWRTDAEVAARWALEGRSGGPPGRPKMSTVPVDKFGAAPPPNLDEAPARPIIEPPYVPERGARAPIASPFFDENVAPFISPNVPATAAEEPVELAAPPDFMASKEGGQKGSNEGGLYRGDDGVLRYVKFYKDPVQGQLEHLANNIYRDLGLPAVKSDLFTAADGRQAYASEVVEGETLAKKFDKAAAKKVLKGFAADVLVGNWDAVGLDHDNVIVSKGKAVRVDNGGALLHRAKAGLKPDAALKKIDEWQKFFDPGTNPAYAKVAAKAGVSRAEDVVGIKQQIAAILKLCDAHGGWGSYIEHVAPGLPEAERKKVIGMLAERTIQLAQKLDEIKVAAKLPKVGPVRVFEKLPQGEYPDTKHIPPGWSSRGRFQDEAGDKLDAVAREVPNFTNALYDYTGGSYRQIRAAGHLGYDAWAAEFPGSSKIKYNQYRAQYDAIDRAFELHNKATSGALANAPEAKVTESFRGLGRLSRAKFDELIGAKQWETESLTSVAWDPHVASGFMYNDADTYAVMLHFKFKATSSNKLAVETRSSQGNQEKEILLRKGARFRVVQVSRLKGRSNRALVELEEI